MFKPSIYFNDRSIAMVLIFWCVFVILLFVVFIAFVFVFFLGGGGGGVVFVILYWLILEALRSPVRNGLTFWLSCVCSYFVCFGTFPYGVLGKVWYLIVLIPDLDLLSYFYTF